jgi:lysophosphatidylglycerol acyltransferase 1
VFKYTNFGIISWFHEDFFILAGKGARESSLIDLRHHLQRSFAKKERKYLVLFPEGGFLRKRKVSRFFPFMFKIWRDLTILQYISL